MLNTILREEERVSIALRTLYTKYGYLPYKMSKFEEYDLYVENKEFLSRGGMITFNDTDGRLMALKPDVTLSIIKNDLDEGAKRKVYYAENVYRISPKTKQFKEVTQVGLECLGEVDLYDVYETVCLAAESLALISDNFRLNLSHLGLVSAILRRADGGEKFNAEVMRSIANKNAHETAELCARYNVNEKDRNALLAFISTYGDMQTVLCSLAPYCQEGAAKKAYEELGALCSLLKNSKYADKIRLDFSVEGDMNYYDNILFKGFIQGISEGVLSGGRYDKLLSRMGRKSGAIGFAVYLDLLEGFNEDTLGADVDVLVLYKEGTPLSKVIEKTNELVQAGKSVRVQKNVGGVRYIELCDLSGGEL